MALSPTSSHGSSGSSAVLAATVSLTNAQILALPTTAIEVAAAPGAGNAIFPCLAIVHRHFTGAYSGIAVAADYPSLNIQTGTGQSVLSSFIDEPDTPNDLLTSLLTGLTQATYWLLPVASRALPVATDPLYVGEGDLAAQEDLPLNMFVVNNGGDFTGGNAANVIRVTVLYTVFAPP